MAICSHTKNFHNYFVIPASIFQGYLSHIYISIYQFTTALEENLNNNAISLNLSITTKKVSSLFPTLSLI